VPDLKSTVQKLASSMPLRYSAGMNATILIVSVGSLLGNAAFALRREVFVFEQAVPEEEELDVHDLTATHFVAIDAGDVVGTLRLIFEPVHVKIGRVVVHRYFRGRGIGKEMIMAAMQHARGEGHERFYLAAQADKTPFYEQFGFTAYGDLFDDGSGIMHRAMKTY
jgi:predicted GNAT family N-acyltransferase